MAINITLYNNVIWLNKSTSKHTPKILSLSGSENIQLIFTNEDIMYYQICPCGVC